MSKLFRGRGFRDHKKETVRRKEEAKKFSNALWRFFIRDTDEEDIPIRFLTEEPILFYEHSVPNGKGFDNVTCKEKGCPHCEDGSKASYKGAWLIVDGREFEYTNKEGKKKTGKDQIRIYARGSQDIARLDRLSQKFGLTSRPYFVTKTGSGTSTSYELDRGELEELTDKELEALLAKLPEKYRDHVDVDDPETLYDIVEDSIFGDIIGDDNDEEDDEDEDEEDIDEGVTSVKKGSKIKKPSGSKIKKPGIKPKASGKKKKPMFKKK